MIISQCQGLDFSGLECSHTDLDGQVIERLERTRETFACLLEQHRKYPLSEAMAVILSQCQGLGFRISVVKEELRHLVTVLTPTNQMAKFFLNYCIMKFCNFSTQVSGVTLQLPGGCSLLGVCKV